VAVVALLMGGYGLLIYPATQKSLQYAENLVHRRLDRIEKRTRLEGEVTASPRALERQVEELDQELERLRTDLAKLGEAFAPVESGVKQQRLLLEISTLARQSGVEMLSLGRGNGIVADTSRGGPPVDRRLGRPLLTLSAHADYWQLLDFLDGLKALSYNVSVMRLGVRSRQLDATGPQKPGQEAALPPGALDLSLVLAI